MPSLVHEKVKQLYHSVSKASVASLDARGRARKVLDVEDLQNYMRDAFLVFGETLEASFDFGRASLRNAPIPLTPLDIRTRVCHGGAAFLATEMLFSLTRESICMTGTAIEIFPKYIGLLDDVLELFYEEHWPCEQRHPRTRARCVNVRARHTKGHQMDNGNVFAAGDYVSEVTLDEYRKEFRDYFYCCLVKLLGRLEKELKSNEEDASERLAAPSIHKDMVLSGFFRCVNPPDWRGSAGPLTSQSACFCCLLEAGQYPLTCGLRILMNNTELALDCDRIWDEYYQLASAAPSVSGSSKRLFRINPFITGTLPALDDVHRMDGLQRDVKRCLATEPKIAEVARQLVASSFYFDLVSADEGILDRSKVKGTTKRSPPDVSSPSSSLFSRGFFPKSNLTHTITFVGKLSCRFQAGSKELKLFGEYLTQRTEAEGLLSLVINCYPPAKPPLATSPLSKMVEAMKTSTLLPQSISFAKNRAVIAIQMELQFGHKEAHLISGFPRSFSSDLDSDYEGRQSRDMHRHSPRSPLSSQYTSPPQSGNWSRSREADWEPPQILDFLPHIDLGHYEDRTRMLGGRRSSRNKAHGVLSNGDADETSDVSSGESSDEDGEEAGWGDWLLGR
jgi:hypothetical protein